MPGMRAASIQKLRANHNFHHLWRMYPGRVNKPNWTMYCGDEHAIQGCLGVFCVGGGGLLLTFTPFQGPSYAAPTLAVTQCQRRSTTAVYASAHTVEGRLISNWRELNGRLRLQQLTYLRLLNPLASEAIARTTYEY